MRPLALLSFVSISLVSATLLTGFFDPAAGSSEDARREGGTAPSDDVALPARPTDAGTVSPGSAPGRLPTSVAPPAPVAAEACPAGMVLIAGGYCPKVKQECVKYMEDPLKFPRARCAEFAPTSECLADKIPLSFCIDKLEAAQENLLPVGDVSWTAAKAVCEGEGKRLCQEREWTLACEGEAMQPYPNGFVRDATACNFDHTEGLVTQKGELADLRQPVDANARCESPYGVRNMVGNIDEWVVLDKPHYSDKNGGRKMMSGLKGGWWGPMRNRCRPTTVDHDEIFHELQTGFRCCL